jgi:hypothetical protein
MILKEPGTKKNSRDAASHDTETNDPNVIASISHLEP